MVGALRFCPAVLVIIGGDIHLAADDRLNAMGRSFVIEIRRCEQVAVVGHRYGRHSAARCFRR